MQPLQDHIGHWLMIYFTAANNCVNCTNGANSTDKSEQHISTRPDRNSRDAVVTFSTVEVPGRLELPPWFGGRRGRPRSARSPVDLPAPSPASTRLVAGASSCSTGPPRPALPLPGDRSADSVQRRQRRGSTGGDSFASRQQLWPRMWGTREKETCGPDSTCRPSTAGPRAAPPPVRRGLLHPLSHMCTAFVREPLRLPFACIGCSAQLQS
jgi:hypothetical protein